jgi:hypothetical protein
MKKQLSALLLGLLLTQPALAGSSTISVTPGSGATYDVVTDGSGNFVGQQVICDQAAAANCAGVNSSHQLAIAGPVTNAGTFVTQSAITAASGSISSGAIASGAVASGAFASGAIGSGAVASGAIASGAVASGAFASGAISDGADVTLGTKADAAWSSGSGTLVAIAKTIATNTGAAIPAGTNNIGSVNAFNGGSTYNTVAASQTAQALTGGGGGATGDYLSHCTVLPTSTSPGVVTIKDNSTTIYAFPGGSSSISNLVPFTIPVGAKSVSGAWTVTTGANLTAVCVGKFS